MPNHLKYPYRLRTKIRRYLPWLMIEMGFAAKGKDCEKSGGIHEWYNKDSSSSACYHCSVIEKGQQWKPNDT